MALCWSERRCAFCGGVIIKRSSVLTAAHCLIKVDKHTGKKHTKKSISIIVKVGDINWRKGRDSKAYRVDFVYPHKKYNHYTHANDIGLIKVRKVT